MIVLLGVGSQSSQEAHWAAMDASWTAFYGGCKPLTSLLSKMWKFGLGLSCWGHNRKGGVLPPLPTFLSESLSCSPTRILNQHFNAFGKRWQLVSLLEAPTDLAQPFMLAGRGDRSHLLSLLAASLGHCTSPARFCTLPSVKKLVCMVLSRIFQTHLESLSPVTRKRPL